MQFFVDTADVDEIKTLIEDNLGTVRSEWQQITASMFQNFMRSACPMATFKVGPQELVHVLLGHSLSRTIGCAFVSAVPQHALSPSKSCERVCPVGLGKRF